jgi:hypothetical protein
MATISLVADGTTIANDVDYDLWCEDLTVYYPVPAATTVTALNTAAQLIAHRDANFDLQIQGTLEAQVLELELRHSPNVLWRIRLTDAER